MVDEQLYIVADFEIMRFFETIRDCEVKKNDYFDRCPFFLNICRNLYFHSTHIT